MGDTLPNVSRKVARPSRPSVRPVARAFAESADWSDHQGPEALYANHPLDLLKCLRPGQWCKNLLLLAAPFFAWFDPSQHGALMSDPMGTAVTLIAAVAAFILVSGAAYTLNDLRDYEKDRVHPFRRDRPIASRHVSGAGAGTLIVCCLAGAAALAWWGVGIAAFAAMLGAYALLQPLYTFVLRRVAGLGVFAVAAGFAMRAAAGALACGVRVSPWLLLGVFLLALFVAVCKQRAEAFLRVGGGKGRPPQPVATLAEQHWLDLQVALTGAAAVAVYALYTLAPETVARYGTERLIWTLPIVMFGVSRYLRIAFKDRDGSRPERIFRRDPVMLVTIVAWGLACAAILGWGKSFG